MTTRLPDVVMRAAALAPGKRMTVEVAGKVYELPLVPEPAPVVPPHPLEAVSKELLERDAVSRALFESVSKNFTEILGRVDESVATVAAGQVQVAESVNEMSGTLHLPVKPVYDKAGKLIGAERVKKL